MPTIYKRNFDDFPFFPGDYNIGEGNTIYDLRTIVIRDVSQFFIVKYTITIQCRMVHSEYISQQRNHSRYKYRPRKGQILFCKKKKKKEENSDLILLKSPLKLISSKCSSFFYWQHISYDWWTYFLINRQLAYLWVQAVLLFSPTCSFISYKADFIQGRGGIVVLIVW